MTMQRGACEIGVIGMGVMGLSLARNFASKGLRTAIWDRTAEKSRSVAAAHPEADFADHAELAGFVGDLERPRRIVLMILAGSPVDEMIHALEPLLDEGDIVIDAGNSLFTDTDRRAAYAAGKPWRFVGMGVSGGEEGALLGPSMMPGGDVQAWQRLQPAFERIAARGPRGVCVTHCGKGSAGHFVKMVHNGIEYGLMAAYAEGMNILKNTNAGKVQREKDAETTPLREPEAYQYDFDLGEIAELWRRGSVVASWLLDLTADAMAKDPQLAQFGGRVSDSGEGRWTIDAAIDEGVPAHVLTAALYERFSSRGNALFADKVCSAMRFEFGGHHEKASGSH